MPSGFRKNGTKLGFQKGHTFNKGIIRSKETKKKISKATKGKNNPNYGKHPTKETKKKMSNSKLGKKNYWYGKKQPKEMIAKRVKKNTGKKRTKAFKQKISLITKGRKFSKEHKKKLSEANSGEKHPNWRGGISFAPYSLDWTEDLRRAIRKRDNYICQLCSKYGKYIHHIDYNKLNCDQNNLITLCKGCHSKTNFKRDYWKLLLSIKILINSVRRK